MSEQKNSHNADPLPPKLEDAITQVIEFGDGSKLIVKVEAPIGSQGQDEATQAFYGLADLLDEIKNQTSLW